MEKSEQVHELATALSQAQGEMGKLIKDKVNPFFRSHYADLAGVLEAIRQPFHKHGLSIVQLPMYCDGSDVALETVLLHSSGQWLSNSTTMPVVKNDPQSHGSAYTYLRRYALMAMVGLAPEDDDGNAATESTKKPERATVAGKRTQQTWPADPTPSGLGSGVTRSEDSWERINSNGQVIEKNDSEKATERTFRIDSDVAKYFRFPAKHPEWFDSFNVGDTIAFKAAKPSAGRNAGKWYADKPVRLPGEKKAPEHEPLKSAEEEAREEREAIQSLEQWQEDYDKQGKGAFGAIKD